MLSPGKTGQVQIQTSIGPLGVNNIERVYFSVFNSAAKVKIQWKPCMGHLGQSLLLPFHFCLIFLTCYRHNVTFSLFQNYFSFSSSNKELERKKSHFSLSPFAYPQAVNTNI